MFTPRPQSAWDKFWGGVGDVVLGTLSFGQCNSKNTSDLSCRQAIGMGPLAFLTDGAAAETDAADSGAARGAMCGGESFSPNTKILMSDGSEVSIAALTVGREILTVDSKTGSQRVEPIAAVLAHHDTDLYDLKVKTAHTVTTVHTTANHAFWDETTRSWVEAAKLHLGDRLHTSNGIFATVMGGADAPKTSGWMWDLTVPTEHDFYVVAGNVPVLVHNAGPYCDISELKGDEPGTAVRLMADSQYHGGPLRGFADTAKPDYEDSLGRTYDAVGGPLAWTNPKYDEAQMIRSIQKHIYLKSGFDYTVLDLTGASSGQIDAVFSNLDSWANNPSMTPQNQLIILGDSY